MRAVTENWKRQIKEMNAFYASFPKRLRHRISYEALASDPEMVLRSLCKSLDIEFERGMLSYWKHEHHHVFGNGGTRYLIYKYRAQVQGESEALAQRITNAEKYYDSGYYRELSPGIVLDERWRRELPADQEEIFNRLAKDLNKPFVWRECSSPSN